MFLTSDTYIPSIRWRMAEYQALLRLSPQAKERIVPFITIPPIEYDFEERRPKKTVQKHIQPFATRFKAKWGKRPAWIAVDSSLNAATMDDDRDLFRHIFDELREFEATAVPALSMNAPDNNIHAISEILKQDGQGVAISVRLEDLMTPNIETQIDELISQLGTTLSYTDLVIDMGAPKRLIRK